MNMSRGVIPTADGLVSETKQCRNSFFNITFHRGKYRLKGGIVSIRSSNLPQLRKFILHGVALDNGSCSCTLVILLLVLLLRSLNFQNQI